MVVSPGPTLEGGCGGMCSQGDEGETDLQIHPIRNSCVFAQKKFDTSDLSAQLWASTVSLP